MGCCASQQQRPQTNNQPQTNYQPQTDQRAQLNNKFPTPIQHPSSDNDDFRVQVGERGARISYQLQSDGDWSSWFKNGEIPRGGTSVFNIRQIKSKAGNIHIGIATGAVFGANRAYQHPQTVTYFSGDGDICQGTGYRRGGRVVQDGSIIRVAVDTLSWQIEWYVDSQLQARAQIPQFIRHKPIFLFIAMIHDNSIVELLYE